MKTKFEQIVNVSHIGERENPIAINELFALAAQENIPSVSKQAENTLLLIVDPQLSFMEKGELGVPGSHGDMERLCRFIYANMLKIKTIAVSLDTHDVFQIFHPCWWVNKEGKNPPPFTEIKLKDLEDGTWSAVQYPKESLKYVRALEKQGRKTLTIWPYHCLMGTTGNAMENQLANMLYFFSLARKSKINYLVKGTAPLSEMYGIFKPEVSSGDCFNFFFLNQMTEYDKIIIAGEAKSHCVFETALQIAEYFESRPEITRKIYFMEDCMSPIAGWEQTSKELFGQLSVKYGMSIVKSTDNF